MPDEKTTTATPAEQVALWADRLRDISAMALHFSTSFHDREAFRAVQSIAIEMLALAAGESLAQMEPLRAPIFSRPTPLAVGDGAVIDDAGRILLIQRSDNARWAMPGGALQVGETPAAGVAREVLEETGVRCRPVALVGVFDSRLCGTVSRHHLYQFTFLCQPVPDSEPEKPSHDLEVLDTGWFLEGELPEALNAGHASRIAAAFQVWHGDRHVYFDEGTR